MTQSIRDLPVNDTLKDFIAKGLWDPRQSGWRPFANAEEAAIIKDERLRARGCNWVGKVVALGESSCKLHLVLSYEARFSRNQEVSYEDLFQSYKTENGSLPCGLPITEIDHKETMTLREQFEAWILSTNWCFDEDDLKVFHSEGNSGYYCNQSLDYAWCGFQAGYAAASKVVKPLVAACSEALANDEVSEGFGARNMEDDLRQILAKAIEEGEAFMKGHGDVAGD